MGVDSVADGIVGNVLCREQVGEKPKLPHYVHHCGEDVVEVTDLKAFVEKQAGGKVRTLSWSDWIEGASALGLNELVATFLATFKREGNMLLMPKLLKGWGPGEDSE